MDTLFAWCLVLSRPRVASRNLDTGRPPTPDRSCNTNFMSLLPYTHITSYLKVVGLVLTHMTAYLAVVGLVGRHGPGLEVDVSIQQTLPHGVNGPVAQLREGPVQQSTVTGRYQHDRVQAVRQWATTRHNNHLISIYLACKLMVFITTVAPLWGLVFILRKLSYIHKAQIENYL